MGERRSERVTVAEMLSFGGAHFGTSIYMAFTSYYLMMFCTDVALIPSAAVGVLLLCYRIFCGIDTQAIGFFINRKHFKGGKYRPYLKWCALPFALSMVALGLTPSITPSFRIFYAALLLFLCDLGWSVLYTASMSMLPYLAKDDVSRTKIMSFSNSSSILAFILIGTFMLPVVGFFGGDNDRRGFAITLTILAAITVPLIFNAYFRLKERYYTETTNKPAVKDIFLALWKNKRLLLFLAGFCIYQLADTFKNLTAYYYMTYVMSRPDLLPAVIMAGLLSPLAMQPVIPRLLKFAKKETLIVFALFASSCSCFFMLAAGNSPIALIVCVVLYGVSTAIVANLVFTVIASFSDDMRANSDINMSEILTAALNLSSNLGAGVAGLIAATTLAEIGYNALADVQTPGAEIGIKAIYILFTAVGMILAGIVMLQFRRKGAKSKELGVRS